MPSSPRWFVRRDLDGFFGLTLDNFIQILLIVSLCQGVLGFSPGLVYQDATSTPAIGFDLAGGEGRVDRAVQSLDRSRYSG